MKKIFILLLFIFYSDYCYAENLIQVYQQALIGDQIFQKIVSQQLATQQGVPISLSSLFPQMGGSASPTINRKRITGAGSCDANKLQHSNNLNLSLTQTVFDFSQFSKVAQSVSLSKQADSIINIAIQDLLLRVANAYFAVLYAEDNLHYNAANKAAYEQQLRDVEQQHKVGIKILTDVYTARASYESAEASYFRAQTQLEDARENLRVITGIYYPRLARLKNNVSFTLPHPINVEAWVRTAQNQNWAIKAAQYGVDAARNNVKQQAAGSLPTLQIQGFYSQSIGSLTASEANLQPIAPGILRSTQWGVNLVLNIPIFQGGYVVSSTRQARYNYQATYSNLEQQVRTVANQARQSYSGIISDIGQIQADQKAIVSGENSLEGLRAGYRMGTKTLVDVLNQQQKLFQSYEHYAKDKYSYINHLLQLKLAAGVLSPKDLETINVWLAD